MKKQTDRAAQSLSLAARMMMLEGILGDEGTDLDDTVAVAVLVAVLVVDGFMMGCLSGRY